MGRSPYQSEKRRKELARLKKQEEKRQRRFNKKHEGEKDQSQTPEGPAEKQEEGATPEELARLALAVPEEDWLLLRTIAEHPHTPPEVLARLVSHPYEAVRENIARHPLDRHALVEGRADRRADLGLCSLLLSF